MAHKPLPIPPHFKEENVGQVWKVNYEQLAKKARQWATKFQIPPAFADTYKICLLGIDIQNTFCLPEFELFVGGRSGKGAVEDNIRLAKFIYRNLDVITQIVLTMDTHQVLQIFHAIFLIDEEGNHPDPYTLVSVEDIESGKWKINPSVCKMLGWDPEFGQRHLLHYTRQLRKSGKYNLTIWPYHAMLGGIGHAIVPAIEEAVFFHSIARYTQPQFEVKGNHPLTENYSVFGPEVKADPDGKTIGGRNEALIQQLMGYDAIIIAGEAKSHCVAWSVEDLISEFQKRDPQLVQRIYLLEDCTSPVVVPGVIDYTEEANRTYQKFAEAGAHIVRSTEPLSEWQGIGART